MNIRKDFPLLKKKIDGKDLIYFDNAATSQKPQAVIDAITTFYTQHNNNIHRGVYQSAEETTAMYEDARKTVASFINAHPEEIVFTKGTTEGINFVVHAWAAHHLQAGDEIVISELEHHSNLIPWLQIAQEKKLKIVYIPVKSDGTLDLSKFSSIISSKTKLVSCLQISNALGSHVAIDTIITAAHNVGAKVLIDAAQSIAHIPVDVKKLKTDFLVFSGHKMGGPTGIGVLYIKKDLHEQTQPYQFGGGMPYEVDYHSVSFAKAPHKFEAGTPGIAQAIGLAAAITYFKKNIDFAQLAKHEAQLCARLIEGLSKHKKIRILGPIEQLKKTGHLVSFVIDGMHAHDVADYLGKEGICVRAGHHCAQPLAKKMGYVASVRASFYAYNTFEEVEKFLNLITLLVSQ
jgi:cysteine desulfurase/selenocysteine lyase